MFTEEQVKRFKAHVNIQSSAECWDWGGSLDHDGYGKVKIGGIVLVSHRVSYEIYKGEFDKAMHVLHSCDNPKCCNPNHMRLGSRKDNMQDMICRSGRRHPSGYKRVGNELVQKILTDFEGGAPKRLIARTYSISTRTVRRVVLQAEGA